jgi:uncharacterized protein
MIVINNLVQIDQLLGDWEPPLAEFVYGFVANDSTGHDIYHCLRVKRLALHISEGEGLDKEIMTATAYLHDIGRERERQGEGDHVDIGIAAAQELLPTLPSFPADKIEAVIRCIEYHEEYAWARTRQAVSGDANLEILGFQDADRLDAIGAVGLARMFTFGGSYQRPLWIPEVKPGHWQHGDLGNSTYNHLYEKLLKLKDTMNTDTGRQLAEARHCFMEQFAEAFEDEWFGRV